MRKNVASQHISFALVVASTGAALTGASPSGYVSKDGGAQAALAGSFTGLGNGQYDYAPTQAETDANEIGFLFTAATAVPVGITVYTTAANPADAAAMGLTNLDAAISTRALEAGGNLATILARIIGTLAAGTHNPQSGDAYARIGAAGASLTALGDTRIANLDATVSSRALEAGGQLDSVMTALGIAAADLAEVVADTSDIQTRLPAALVSGKMDSDMQAAAAGVITASVAPNLDASVSSRATVATIFAQIIEGSETLLTAMRFLLDAIAANTTGFPGSPVVEKLAGGTRLAATLDADGNRTVTTRDGT